MSGVFDLNPNYQVASRRDLLAPSPPRPERIPRRVDGLCSLVTKLSTDWWIEQARARRRTARLKPQRLWLSRFRIQVSEDLLDDVAASVRTMIGIAPPQAG